MVENGGGAVTQRTPGETAKIDIFKDENKLLTGLTRDKKKEQLMLDLS